MLVEQEIEFTDAPNSRLAIEGQPVANKESKAYGNKN